MEAATDVSTLLDMTLAQGYPPSRRGLVNLIILFNFYLFFNLKKFSIMAIQYVVKQNVRKGGNQLWYGRAVHPSTVGLDVIAERVQRNCSMTKGDVLCVMTEMVAVMKDEIQNSNKVKIDGLGTFYINLRTSGSVSEEGFNAQDNVKGFAVKFLAEGKKRNGNLTRTFTDGLRAQKVAGASSAAGADAA